MPDRLDKIRERAERGSVLDATRSDILYLLARLESVEQAWQVVVAAKEVEIRELKQTLDSWESDYREVT